MKEKTKKALSRLHNKIALKQNECSFVDFLKKNPNILRYSSKAKAKRYFMSLARYSEDLNILFKAAYQDVLEEQVFNKESVLLNYAKKTLINKQNKL